MHRLILSLFIIASVSCRAAANELPVWSYEGLDNGQDAWSHLSPAYALCEGGTKQSPIIIAYTERSELPRLEFSYKPEEIKIEATAQMMRITFEGKSNLVIDKNHYQLLAAEFHAPSEHMVRDQFMPMEIHLFHQDAAGQKLNLSILVEKGAENEAFNALIQKLPAAIGQKNPLKFDFSKILPNSFGYYAYQGSMTTPPCNEGVEWRVLKRPITLSAEQLEAISNLHGRSARLEQPIYGRIIYETAY
jgi:carbonic anhydrase